MKAARISRDDDDSASAKVKLLLGSLDQPSASTSAFCQVRGWYEYRLSAVALAITEGVKMEVPPSQTIEASRKATGDRLDQAGRTLVAVSAKHGLTRDVVQQLSFLRASLKDFEYVATLSVVQSRARGISYVGARSRVLACLEEFDSFRSVLDDSEVLERPKFSTREQKILDVLSGCQLTASQIAGKIPGPIDAKQVRNLIAGMRKKLLLLK